MKIKITGLVAGGGNADEYDIVQIKKALNRLGYYMPYEKVGIIGMPDSAIFEAIKKFQKENGIHVSGEIRPDDVTEEAINKALLKEPEGYYLWRTVEDGKVRASHAQYNRKLRKWSDSPDPGDDFNCRCWAQAVSKDEAGAVYGDAIKPFYPELLLPIVKIGNLYKSWKIWIESNNTNWKLGKFKSDIKWGNQLKSRDWTPEQITDTIKFGKRHSAPNKVNPSNGATRYEYRNRFVVKDNKTDEILQVSGKDFTPNKIIEP